MADGEKEALLGHTHRAYPRRWLVLLYSICVYILLVAGWNTWGPITQSMESVYGWDASILANILNVGRASVIACLIPVSYMLDKKSLRFSFIFCLCLVIPANILRCLMQLDSQSATWLGILSQVFLGVANIVAYGGPPLVSVVWFPAHERTFATAVGVISGYVAYGIIFVLEPQLVSAPQLVAVTQTGNTSWNNISSEKDVVSENIDVNNNSLDISYIVSNMDIMKSEIVSLIYIETCISAVLLIIAVTLLPKAPPTPPSTSSGVTRINYSSVLTGLLKNGFLCLLIFYTGTLVAFYASWFSIIEIALEPLNISQDTGGWLGFYISLASGAVTSVCARISDMYGRKSNSKMILVVMLTVSSLFFLWLSLLCGKHIPYQLEQLYASAIIGSAFMTGCFPLLYERICEAAFPIPEGITMGLTTLVTNFAGIIYVLPLSLTPDTDNSWLEWTILGTGLVGIVVILVTPQRYGRADMDLAVTVRTDVKYEHLDSETTKVDSEPVKCISQCTKL